MAERDRGVTCLACGGRFPAFRLYGLPPREGLCPRCGAKPRHRALLLFLGQRVRPRLLAGGEVLEIGPSRPSTRLVPRPSAIGRARYTAIDLDRRPHHARLRPPHRFLRMDARRLRFPDGAFDVVLCNHVLPFTPDDRAILAEIRRCLRPDGVAMIDVDIQVARTLAPAVLARRAPRRFTPEYVATNGSHRFYGRDFPARVRAAGLHPVRLDLLRGLSPAFRRAHGLKADGRAWLAFRDRAAAAAFARTAAGRGRAPARATS